MIQLNALQTQQASQLDYSVKFHKLSERTTIRDLNCALFTKRYFVEGLSSFQSDSSDIGNCRYRRRLFNLQEIPAKVAWRSHTSFIF
ncbi:hypothetical protein JTB14_002517 [Gonioctena quinquepunctata]|nr:hypothetical protein JTB14_002517 [Gonioctena quinquepunctata]